MHFFNPAPVLPLVEVVRTSSHPTRPTTRLPRSRRARQGADPLQRHAGLRRQPDPDPAPERLRARDRRGAGDARGPRPGDALRTNWPIGPCALLDLIGVDVHVHASEALWEALREPRMAPPPRLVRMAQAGTLGRKTGRGLLRLRACPWPPRPPGRRSRPAARLAPLAAGCIALGPWRYCLSCGASALAPLPATPQELAQSAPARRREGVACRTAGGAPRALGARSGRRPRRPPARRASPRGCTGSPPCTTRLIQACSPGQVPDGGRVPRRGPPRSRRSGPGCAKARE